MKGEAGVDGMPAQRPASFREVFTVGEFRALWLAEFQSVMGDQLARVALTVLVFQRTGSAGLTALTYALTLLPDLVSGPLLAGLADRFPRRQVMITADLLRASLVAAMALPNMPFALLAALLVAVQFCAAPFSAAQQATLPTVLEGDRYTVGQAIRQTTRQVALVAGFAGGGVVVAAIGTRQALAVDAATFALSAVLIGLGVRTRPAPDTTSTGVQSYLGRMAAGAWVIWRDARLRSLVAVSWLAGFIVMPEGLAAPYAHEIGAGGAAVGGLLAAHAGGAAIGAVLIGRWCPPAWRLRLIGPMAVVAMLPLIGYAMRPGLAVAMVLLALSGVCAAYQVPTAATFMRLVPDASRGQAYGLAGSGLKAAQGLGIAAGGVLAQALNSAATAIASAACVGALVAATAAASWRRNGLCTLSDSL